MDKNVYVKKCFCTRSEVVRDINSLTTLARIKLVRFIATYQKCVHRSRWTFYGITS